MRLRNLDTHMIFKRQEAKKRRKISASPTQRLPGHGLGEKVKRQILIRAKERINS